MAQRKRAWLITRKSLDRNQSSLHRVNSSRVEWRISNPLIRVRVPIHAVRLVSTVVVRLPCKQKVMGPIPIRGIFTSIAQSGRASALLTECHGFNSRWMYSMWMSELVKEGVLRTPGVSRVGSSPTPHIGLARTSWSATPLCIVISTRTICFERGTSMCLRLEEHPLERPRHLDPSLCRGDLGLLLKPFTGIFLGLNNNGLHLKM